MHVAVLVNDPEALVATQTTAMLIHKAADRGYVVDVVGVDGLTSTAEGRVHGRGKRVPAPSREALVEALRTADAHAVDLSEVDVLLMRTNPARDARRWAHEAALSFAGLLEAQGVLVLNRPEGLLRARDKLYLQRLPASVYPATLVSRDADAIRAFIRDLDGPAVLKPLQGTRGTDVFFADAPDAPNLRPIIDVLTRQGFAVVQEYLPEAAEGDTRVVVMDGEVLEIAERAAAIRRVPAGDDFRSNLHAGGTAQPASVTSAMRAAVEEIGPMLRADGLFLVGLDFIGGRIIEVNAFSTGGLHHAERFEEVDFCAAVFDAIELRLERMT